MAIFRMWQCGAVAVIAAMSVAMVVSSGSLHNADQMDSRSHEPSALASE